MNRRLFLLSSLLVLVALLLAACGGAATPTSAPVPTKAPGTATAAPTIVANTPSKPSTESSAFKTKSNSGGSVDVDVTPTALEIGQPIAFDIAMNTHSVDLSDNMTKITLLRDDAGKEYKPTAWEGGEAGGHHREGTLKFAPLAGKPKYVELVIKGLAKVPERVFKWDLP